MSVMGIDPSLTSTGMVVLWGTGEQWRALTSKRRGVERIRDLADPLIETAEKTRPDLIAIEGYAFGAKGRALFDLAEFGGVLRYNLWLGGHNYIDVPPSTVKKFATGRGNAKKDEIMLAVYKRWGVEFHTSDEADAYVLARIALALTEGDRNLTEFQREVVKALRSKEPERFKEMVEWTERGTSSR